MSNFKPDDKQPPLSRKIGLEKADVSLFPSFFSPAEADHFLHILHSTVQWRQDKVRVFGKVHDQPRLTAYYGDPALSYTYSGLTLQPHPWTPELLEIRSRVEAAANTKFTSVLLNLYRNGRDSMGWHSDDEPELGPNPIIASVSFGAERRFHLRLKKESKVKESLILPHGSLLIMQGETQHHYQHQLPKTSRKVGPRINLTFRLIMS